MKPIKVGLMGIGTVGAGTFKAFRVDIRGTRLPLQVSVEPFVK